jgi:hypothetical protein
MRKRFIGMAAMTVCALGFLGASPAWASGGPSGTQGCAIMHGLTKAQTTPVGPSAGIPMVPIGGGILGAVVVAVALKATIFRSPKGAHR